MVNISHVDEEFKSWKMKVPSVARVCYVNIRYITITFYHEWSHTEGLSDRHQLKATLSVASGAP